MAATNIKNFPKGRKNHNLDVHETQVIGDDGIRLDEKLKDASKYKELKEQIDGIKEGTITVGLARGLYSPTKITQNNQSFIERTTGGSDSVSSGEAQINSIAGTNNYSTISANRIADVINTKQVIEKIPYEVTSIDSIAFNQNVYIEGQNDYKYIRDDDGDFYYTPEGGSPKSLETSGITLSNDTIPVVGDIFTIQFVDHSSFIYTVDYAAQSHTTISFNDAKLKDKMFNNCAPGTVVEATIINTAFNIWTIEGTIVTLSDYGITISGNIIGDKISLKLTRGNFGTIEFSTPTKFKSLGFNSFNGFDPTTMVLKNHKINNITGKIEFEEGKNVCFIKAIYNSNNENGYTVYDELFTSENNNITCIATYNSIPEEGDTVTIFKNSDFTKITRVTFNSTCYIIVSCKDYSKLCVHPTWSGYVDNIYVPYNENIVDLPEKDTQGNYINYWNIGNVSNNVNYNNYKYNKLIDRIAYTAQGLKNFVDNNYIENVDYIYDNNWIYYKVIQQYITAVDISTSYTNKYFCNDFSTEEFIGTTLPVICSFTYTANLVDKLRNDVVTTSALEEAISETLMVTIDEDDYIALRDSNDPNNQLDLTKEYRVLRSNNTVKLMKKPYSTIRINQKGFLRQPNRMISGDIAYNDTDLNIVNWIRNNSHMYVGKLDNDTFKIKQLNDFDRTKYADGTDASTDIATLGYDVFMKLPEFWYKSVETSNNSDLWDISFANNINHIDNTWNHYKGNKFIGVYEGYVEVDAETPTNTKLYSCSGKTPTVNTSQANFKLYARQKGNDSRNITEGVANSGYKIVDYEIHTVMAILGYAYYGTTDIQSVCGSGTSSYPKPCGGRNNLGMSDTIINIDGNNGSINYWGIENWWGDLYEFMDDLITANNTGLVNVRNYNNTDNIRQVQVDTTQFTLSADRCISKLTFGEHCDLIPKAGVTNSGYNTHFADVGYVSAGSGHVAVRSSSAAYAAGGLACLGLSYGASNTNGNVGSRLLYEGAYTLVDSFA